MEGVSAIMEIEVSKDRFIQIMAEVAGQAASSKEPLEGFIDRFGEANTDRRDIHCVGRKYSKGGISCQVILLASRTHRLWRVVSCSPSLAPTAHPRFRVRFPTR